MITDGCVQFQVEIKQVEVCLFDAILISVVRSMDVAFIRERCISTVCYILRQFNVFVSPQRISVCNIYAGIGGIYHDFFIFVFLLCLPSHRDVGPSWFTFVCSSVDLSLCCESSVWSNTRH